MVTEGTNADIDADASTEDVLALRGSGWEGDLEQLRSVRSATRGSASDR